MTDGTAVEPFLVRAIDNYLPSEKTDLKFKKGQAITVEKINADGDMYFGFYAKKEGWFPDYYATKVKGGKPELRKSSGRKTTKKNSIDKTPAASAPEAVEQDKEVPSTKQDTGTASKKDLKKQMQLKRKEERQAKKLAAQKKGGTARGKKGKKNKGADVADGAPVIPPIVEDTITYLEHEDRLHLEGLFRVSGSLNEVKLMKECYFKGKNVDLAKCPDPHTIAGVLKIYFRESADPLLTFAMYDAWIKAMAETNDGPKVLAQKLRLVLKRIPLLNQLILQRLMSLLVKVAANSDKNFMNVNNIAIVFAPTLLRPPGDAIEAAISNSSYSNNLVKFMIEQYDLIFNESEETENSDDELEKKMKRGSLLLARGSFIGGTPPFKDNPNGNPVVPEKPANPANDPPQKPPPAKPAPATPSKPSSAAPSEEKDSDTGTDTVDPEEEEEENSDSDGDSGDVKSLTMEEMMAKILEGSVNEVDEYLATLDPTEASTTKKDLLKRIDDFLKTEEFADD